MRILFVLFLVFLLWAGVGLAYFASAADTPPGIDLILLIDQSNSMSGTAPSTLRTDPETRRVYTARYLIDYVAFDNNFVNPQRTNRVAVIGFGSPERTHIMVNLTPLKNQSDIDLAKSRVISEALGATNFISAFKLVREIFPPSTDSEISDGQRQRVIVLITDGGPFDDRQLSLSEYLKEIAAYYAGQLGGERFPTFLIGIDDQDAYWPLVEQQWKSMLGADNVLRVRKIEEVNKEVVAKLCPFLNERGASTTACRLQDLGAHFIQPYAKSLQFSFFKYDKDAKLSLYRPDGTLVPPRPGGDVSDYQTTGPNEMYVMENPKAGCWLSERVGTGKVDVFTQVVFNNMRLTEPNDAHPVILPLTLEMELRDPSGTLIDEDPSYPIVFDTQLVAAGANVSKTITIQKTGAGRYATANPILLTNPIAHIFTISGTTVLKNVSNLPVECRQRLFEQAQAAGNTSDVRFPIFAQKFEIPVYTPSLHLVTPTAPHLAYSPLNELAFEFLDKDNKPLALPNTLPWTVSLKLKSPNGQDIQLPAPVLENNAYRVKTPIFLPDAGTYTATLTLYNPSGAQVFSSQVNFEVAENVEVVRPGPNHPAYAPLSSVEIQLRDLQNNPTQENPAYPLRIEAVMNFPDGASDTVELTPDANRPGYYFAPVTWELKQAAAYPLEIVGYTAPRPGDPEVVAFRAKRSINVTSNLPFLRIVSPDATKALPEYWLHYWYLPPMLPQSLMPMPLRTEWRYGNQTAEANKFFRNVELKLDVIDAQSKSRVQDVELKSIAGSQTIYGTDLPELSTEGVYTATVRIKATALGNVPTLGAYPDLVASFVRRDPVWYYVAWYALIALIIIAALFIIGRWILCRFVMPKPKGTLIAETTGLNSTVIQEFPLTRRQSACITIKRQQISPALGLKQIKVKHASKGRGNNQEKGIQVEWVNKLGKHSPPKRLYEKTQQKIIAEKTESGEQYQFRYAGD